LPSKAQTDKSAGSYAVSSADAGKSDLDKIFRFGLLRNELMELEKRVQRSTIRSENEEVMHEFYKIIILDAIS